MGMDLRTWILGSDPFTNAYKTALLHFSYVTPGSRSFLLLIRNWITTEKDGTSANWDVTTAYKE